MARDQFDKMRAYYGERYVDYLAALGVSANWQILEEPERIGQQHTEWRFRQVAATSNVTGGDDLADTAGYFQSEVELPVKRTFCPEHGLLAFFSVARTDMLRAGGLVNPMLQKETWDDYWSPELETNKKKLWPDIVWTGNGVAGAENYATALWEEYRKGMNLNAEGDVANQNAYGFNDVFATQSFFRYMVSQPTSVADQLNTGRLGGDEQYQATATYRLVRNSPVRKHGTQQPVF